MLTLSLGNKNKTRWNLQRQLSCGYARYQRLCPRVLALIDLGRVVETALTGEHLAPALGVDGIVQRQPSTARGSPPQTNNPAEAGLSLEKVGALSRRRSRHGGRTPQLRMGGPSPASRTRLKRPRRAPVYRLPRGLSRCGSNDENAGEHSGYEACDGQRIKYHGRISWL